MSTSQIPKIVPIQMTDTLIFDDAFSSMKERFANEMKRIEDEMNKFRVQFRPEKRKGKVSLNIDMTPVLQMLTRARKIINGKDGKALVCADVMYLVGQSTTVHTGTPTDIPATDWDTLTSSPLVEGEGENRTLKLKFDVGHFDPAEVTVRMVDNKLVVQATHEKKTDGSSTYRQYHREFQFPQGVDPERIASFLSKDGILTVEAPLLVSTFEKPAIK